jgi:flagellar protein FlbD
VIIVTRLSGQKMAVNSELIERIECTPDTILVMVDGSRHIVSETIEETVDLICDFRARVISRALDLPAPEPCPRGRGQDALRLVSVSDSSLGDA